MKMRYYTLISLVSIKHYSTDTCLSYLTERLRNGFGKGLLTGMILIDLQKAFDTIDHSILLEKMKCLSFSESTIRWFTSYLSNRSFIVSVGKELSSRGKLNCGVPQGSILAPLLFLLYVNDMPQAVNSELLLYADDTCLFFKGKDSKIIGDQNNWRPFCYSGYHWSLVCKNIFLEICKFQT